MRLGHNVELCQFRSRNFSLQIKLTYIIKEPVMNNLIWIVGAVVIVLFLLSFLGFR